MVFSQPLSVRCLDGLTIGDGWTHRGSVVAQTGGRTGQRYAVFSYSSHRKVAAVGAKTTTLSVKRTSHTATRPSPPPKPPG
jgi:hypothetical protein